MDIRINTGKELLDSGITKFEVCNGAWIGEVIIRNEQSYLYCKDYAGTTVRSFSFDNETKLDLIIKPIIYDCKKQDVVHIGGKLRDISGLLVGTPIKYNDKIVGVIESVNTENNTYTGTISIDYWDKLIDGETLISSSIEMCRE